MDYRKSIEEMEKTIEELIEENKIIPVIVEGERDVAALKKLGLIGELIIFNRGMSIANFCDMIQKKYREIIILTDWDRKGGFLCSMLKKNLESTVKCNLKYRKIFARRSTTKTVEGLPSWITSLKEKVNYY